MAAERVLVDTSILIYATLANDPRYERARAVLLPPARTTRMLHISVQNLAEMYPNLTGPKMSMPDSPRQAREKITSISALPAIQLLPVTPDVVLKALELCDRYEITRQRYFDMQLVATMIVNRIDTIFTENLRDFQMISEITAVNPLA
jgi:predicted nucleic acid-binding protein